MCRIQDENSVELNKTAQTKFKWQNPLGSCGERICMECLVDHARIYRAFIQQVPNRFVFFSQNECPQNPHCSPFNSNNIIAWRAMWCCLPQSAPSM